MTVDQVSGSRVNVGVGNGGPPNAYGAYGYEQWSPRERADRLAEQVVILRRLLQGEMVDADGAHYPVRDARVSRPLQQPHPPIVIAAHGERGLRLVAEQADGWNCLGGQPYPAGRDPSKRISLSEAVAETKRLSDRLDEICHKVGRDPTTVSRSIAAIWPTPDPLTSLDTFDEYVGSYQEIGIDEVIFYWPAMENLRARQPISSKQWAMFERIAVERLPQYQALKGTA